MKHRQVTVFQSVEAGTKIAVFCGLDKSSTFGIDGGSGAKGGLNDVHLRV